MNKIEKYLSEISISHDLVWEETYALFLQAIGEVYNAVGSACVYQDGAVLVAKKSDNGKLYLKHYIVSAKVYEKINSAFEKLLQAYTIKKTTEKFIFANIGKVIDVEIVKVTQRNVYVSPVLQTGSALGYKFILKKNKCFYEEDLTVGRRFKVVYKRVLRDEKIVSVHRFDELVCEAIFTEMFHKAIEVIEEDYSFSEVDFVLDFRRKRVLIFVKWKKLPTYFFRNYLENELKKEFGNVNLMIKKSRRKNEAN